MEIEKIYYDLSTDKAYRSDKTEIANDNIPQFRYKGKKQIQWQFLNTATGGVFTDVYTGFSALTIAGTTSIDNNSVHYYDGVPNATITGGAAITTIAVKTLSGTPRICGRIKLTNAAGDTDIINYNGFTLANAIYTFTLANASYVIGAQTPVNSYNTTTSTARVLEIPIVKDATVDVTGKATGIFTTTLDCFKLVYQDLIEGETEIQDCKLEIIITDATPENIMVKQIPVKCLGLQDDDGAIGPAPVSDYYTKVQSDLRYYLISSPVTLAFANPLVASLTTGTFRKVTATGDFTLAPPTNPTEGAKIEFWITASGADRTMTLNAAIVIPTDSAFSSPVVLASGKVYIVQLKYGGSAWWLTSFVGGY